MRLLHSLHRCCMPTGRFRISLRHYSLRRLRADRGGCCRTFSRGRAGGDCSYLCKHLRTTPTTYTCLKHASRTLTVAPNSAGRQHVAATSHPAAHPHLETLSYNAFQHHRGAAGCRRARVMVYSALPRPHAHADAPLPAAMPFQATAAHPLNARRSSRAVPTPIR